MLIENARELFEISKDVTYLNCANMAPQLKTVTEAGLRAVRAKASPWKLTAAEWFSGAETLRTLPARLLQVEAHGIALVPAASYGIAIAAANLPITKSQTIVLIDQEFPSNVYAWREVARKTGARIRTARRHGSTSWTEALEDEIDEQTAIVALPQCHWTDGSKIDLERIGERVREGGAALVIDASQSLAPAPWMWARYNQFSWSQLVTSGCSGRMDSGICTSLRNGGMEYRLSSRGLRVPEAKTSLASLITETNIDRELADLIWASSPSLCSSQWQRRLCSRSSLGDRQHP